MSGLRTRIFFFLLENKDRYILIIVAKRVVVGGGATFCKCRHVEWFLTKSDDELGLEQTAAHRLEASIFLKSPR